MDNNQVKRDGIIPDILAIIAWVVIGGICLYCLCSCGVSKPVIEYRDSIRVEYRDRIVRDTAYFEIPVEVEKVVTRDTASHLVNGYSASDAVVSGGFLHHSLTTRPQKVPVPVEVHVTDTLIVEKEAQIVEKEVRVEKDLTAWQKFRLGAFWWLVAIAIIGWRRELLALVKKLVKLCGGILI
jgi:hypothetical protein